MPPSPLRPPSIEESGEALAPIAPQPLAWPTVFDTPAEVERAWSDFVGNHPDEEQALFRRALEFARAKHGAQRRRGSDTPYWIHPVRVAMELARWGEDTPALVQAALLHDVLEDTATTPSELAEAFGPEVAGMVSWLTAPEGGRTDDVRAYYQHLARTAPAAVRLLKIADRADNLRSIQALVMRTGARHRRWAGSYLDSTRWQVLPLAAEAPSVARVALVTAMADLAPLVGGDDGLAPEADDALNRPDEITDA
ncbi:MAG TPA: HD domain-containing protein [Miltoncostaeaceae bacterium]|nr:HD domain-containing protein [Miltoncostaeaceae bacterium]